MCQIYDRTRQNNVCSTVNACHKGGGGSKRGRLVSGGGGEGTELCTRVAQIETFKWACVGLSRVLASNSLCERERGYCPPRERLLWITITGKYKLK